MEKHPKGKPASDDALLAVSQGNNHFHNPIINFFEQTTAEAVRCASLKTHGAACHSKLHLQIYAMPLLQLLDDSALPMFTQMA